jgi:hypothetical protein
VKYKKIEFIADNQQVIDTFDPPISTSKILPEWYKDQRKHTTGTFIMGKNGNPNHTIKACMPVFDVMSAGYTITMPADAYFEKNGNEYSVHWSTKMLSLIENHPIPQYNEISVPDGYYPVAFKLVQPWIIKTPPGYSCLFINPTYRFDSPVMILPSIVDTDKHPVSINFPFFIKNDFEGILEFGTPMIQVIPFKREDWKHEVGIDKDLRLRNSFEMAQKKITNRYKTFYRSIKRWE